MATTYLDREDEFDLGDGHSFRWFQDSDGVLGLIEHHPPAAEDKSKGALYCGGYIAWREGLGLSSKHRLVSGGPGDEEHTTVEPSIGCNHCSNHGCIRDGRWVSV